MAQEKICPFLGRDGLCKFPHIHDEAGHNIWPTEMDNTTGLCKARSTTQFIDCYNIQMNAD